MNPSTPAPEAAVLITVFLFVTLLSLVGLTLRWPAIAPPIMLMGMQVLGLLVGSAGLYVQHSIVYIVTFLGALALIANTSRGGRPLAADMASMTLLFFGLLMVAGYLVAPSIIRPVSWLKIQMFGALAVLPFMLARSFARDDRSASPTVNCIAWFAVFYTPFVAAMVIRGDYRTMGASRFDEMGGPIGVGRIFGFAAMFMAVMFFRKGMAAWKRALFMLGIASALIVAFASESRGPFLGLLFGTITMALIGRKLSIKIVMLIVVPMVLLFSMAMLSREGAWRRIVGRVLAGEEDIRELSTGRTDLYGHTVAGIREAPVFGHGTAGIGLVTQVYHKIDHPHNLLLEVLYEHGFVGMTCFALFMLAVLRGLRRFLRNEYLSMPLRRVYAGLFVHALINLQFSCHFAEVPEFWFACGLVSGNFMPRTQAHEARLDTGDVTMSDYDALRQRGYSGVGDAPV